MDANANAVAIQTLKLEYEGFSVDAGGHRAGGDLAPPDDDAGTHRQPAAPA